MSYFLTTAIDYTNAAPHIGHAYEKILTDVIARYHRLKGEKVYFLTGVDQHGQKVQQAAQKENISPSEFAQRETAKFLALWEKLLIQKDGWAATTDPRHKLCVQKALQKLHDHGDLYKARHSGFYSVRQEQFLTDKERGPDGNFGPEWGEVVEIEEENWYFRLSKYKEWLLAFIDSNPNYVTPHFRQVELRNAVERLSGDLCISRPKARLEWGIELPFDPNFVTYVWFDALMNYASFAGFNGAANSGLPDFSELWPCDIQVIGKDILIPAHGVYWAIMLHALGFSDEGIPPLLVHGYINIGGAKMSKSLGNSVDPNVLSDQYGPEALRYYLMRDCATGQDMEFSVERLEQRYNSDLANDLGNLLNRTLNMTQRYRHGLLKRPAAADLAELAAQTVATYCGHMDKFEIHSALETAWALASRCNAYVEESAPWKLAKDPAQAERLDAVLYNLAESLRILAILIAPVMPKSAEAIFAQLQCQSALSLEQAAWGGLAEGHQLGSPTPLFPRLEPKAEA